MARLTVDPETFEILRRARCQALAALHTAEMAVALLDSVLAEAAPSAEEALPDAGAGGVPPERPDLPPTFGRRRAEPPAGLPPRGPDGMIGG